ncbi:MAG TPA: DUF427 domain-containing protein [Microlunatus sp.]
MRSHPRPEPTKPGQESVWSYPRPPALRRSSKPVRVTLGGVVVCDAPESWLVLETSHPPTYYLPRSAFVDGSLRPAPGGSYCEWKGPAGYLDVVGGRAAPAAAWYYPSPSPGFEVLVDHVALYAGRMDCCTVGDETVTPQPGGFYGGWITQELTGPFKGEPGTNHW